MYRGDLKFHGPDKLALFKGISNSMASQRGAFQYISLKFSNKGQMSYVLLKKLVAVKDFLSFLSMPL